MTHTVATMEVSPLTFEEIKRKLEAAGYDHAVHEQDETTLLDMSGIGLEPSAELPDTLPDDTVWTLEEIQAQRVTATNGGPVNLKGPHYAGLLDLAEAALQVMLHIPSKE